METKKHNKKTGSPTQVIVGSFVVVILVGTLLLLLPFATRRPITWLDALFTATSATCVTGLVVVDTYSAFTPFGQGVVLALIQVGGLGLVTLTSFFTIAVRRRMGFRTLVLANESISASGLEQVRALLALVIRLALVLEGTGALLLCFAFVPQFGPSGIWISVFLSISAFCNAGFDILGRLAPFTSLTGYTANWYVQIIIMLLIIGGGLGFVVWQDLVNWRRSRHLSLHTRVVLVFTVALVLGGALGFGLLEWSNAETLGPLPPADRMMASMFQSVSARTAGFNTVDLAVTTPLTRMLMCILMFIGAAPGGTGGGIKITTFSVLMVAVGCVIKGREDAVIFGRRIPKKTVYRALAIAVLGILAVLVATVTIFFYTSKDVSELDSLFEAVSAFATVGLSVGVTAIMHPTAKFITIATMFIGRVGPVSLAISLASPENERKKWEVLPEGKINVG